MKFGARYNYTELERVSQINENGTFTINSDLRRSTPPIRAPIPSGCRSGWARSTSSSRTTPVELYAQDKWKIGGRTTLSIGVRYDLEIIPLDETDNPLFSAVEGLSHRPATTSRRASDSRRTFDDQRQVGAFAAATASSTTAPSSARSTTCSNSRSSRRRTSSTFPNASADPGPSRGPFPDRSAPRQRAGRQSGAARTSCSRRARASRTPAS